jgi:regulator of replication initiation timing
MGEATTTTQDLKQKLSQHIDSAREKLEALKKDISEMHEEDKEILRLKREQIRLHLDEQKSKAQRLQADIQQWKEEKVAHTQEAIGNWRQQRELKKLRTRAERAEDYALDMVNIAALDFEEAEQAVLDALAARLDAQVAEAFTPAPA